MAVYQNAISSPRNMYSGVLTTTSATLYTAPAVSTNVTSPSATAYMKEIIICNYSASAVTVTVSVGGQYIICGLTVNGNDTKVLSGLNTMISAGGTITGLASVASSIVLVISGVEVQ